MDVLDTLIKKKFIDIIENLEAEINLSIRPPPPVPQLQL
jgi:hypothetical protein